MSDVGHRLFDEDAEPEVRGVQGRMVFEDEQVDGQERLFDVPAEDVPPVEFQAFDFSIQTEFCCPRCGYEWGGAPK